MAVATKTKFEIDITNITIEKTKLVVHDDDSTPFEFVVRLLMDVCGLGVGKAANLTHSVHTNGREVVLVGSEEVTTSKRSIMLNRASAEGHIAFNVTVEKE